jgi:hypothetical protein
MGKIETYSAKTTPHDNDLLFLGDSETLDGDGDMTTRKVTVASLRTPRAATLVVAASNAPAVTKAAADYVCDGTADEAEINSAIDALGTVGGTVLLSEGTFTVAAAGSVTGDSVTTPYCIRIRETHGAVDLIGMGQGATKIVLANSQAANSIPILVRGTSTTNRTAATRIAHMEIDGNDGGGQTTWTDFGLVEALYSYYVTLEDCYIHDAPFFLTQTFRQSQFARWVNCRFYADATNHQVRFENPNVTIENCQFRGPVAAATGPAMLALATNADIGVQTENALVIGNLFQGGYQHIAMDGAARCVIASNSFRDITTNNPTAVRMAHYDGGSGYNATENVITGNMFYNVRYGVQLDSRSDATDRGAKRNRVTNNYFIDGPDVTFATGVRETGSYADDNLVEGNRFYGVSTPTIKVGANSVFRNNQGDTNAADFIAGVRIREADGSPNVAVVKDLIVSNGTLTDNGSNVATLTTGGGGGTLTVQEVDGTPSVSSVSTLIVTNGTLTDNGSGSVTVVTGGGGSGVGSKSINILNGGYGSVTPTAAPTVAVAESSTRTRTIADLSSYTSARIMLNVVTVNTAAAEYGIQYSSDGGSTWAWLDGTVDTGTGTPRRAVTATGVGTSAWATLAAGAKTEVILRLVHLTASGTAPAFARIDYEFK